MTNIKVTIAVAAALIALGAGGTAYAVSSAADDNGAGNAAASVAVDDVVAEQVAARASFLELARGALKGFDAGTVDSMSTDARARAAETFREVSYYASSSDFELWQGFADALAGTATADQVRELLPALVASAR